MKNKKIDFRITEQIYDRIMEESEKAGISANAWARDTVTKAASQKEELSGQRESKLNNMTSLSHMEISRELIRMQHFIEKLPEKSEVKNELGKGLEKVWLLLS